jgi:hypothetical protein
MPQRARFYPSRLPPHSSRPLRASIQRVVHRGENLIDDDVPVVVRVSGLAVEELGAAEDDVDHREEFIDVRAEMGAIVFGDALQASGRSRWCRCRS